MQRNSSDTKATEMIFKAGADLSILYEICSSLKRQYAVLHCLEQKKANNYLKFSLDQQIKKQRDKIKNMVNKNVNFSKFIQSLTTYFALLIENTSDATRQEVFNGSLIMGRKFSNPRTFSVWCAWKEEGIQLIRDYADPQTEETLTHYNNSWALILASLKTGYYSITSFFAIISEKYNQLTQKINLSSIVTLLFSYVLLEHNKSADEALLKPDTIFKIISILFLCVAFLELLRVIDLSASLKIILSRQEDTLRFGAFLLNVLCTPYSQFLQNKATLPSSHDQSADAYPYPYPIVNIFKFESPQYQEPPSKQRIHVPKEKKSRPVVAPIPEILDTLKIPDCKGSYFLITSGCKKGTYYHSNQEKLHKIGKSVQDMESISETIVTMLKEGIKPANFKGEGLKLAPEGAPEHPYKFKFKGSKGFLRLWVAARSPTTNEQLNLTADSIVLSPRKFTSK